MEQGARLPFFDGCRAASGLDDRQLIPAAIGRLCTSFCRVTARPKDGIYTFTLSSDDGSWLRVGGATVVDHDGPHATSAKSGRVVLKEGAYPLEIGYFQAGGDASLAAWIEGPGIPRQPLAGGTLFREQPEK